MYIFIGGVEQMNTVKKIIINNSDYEMRKNQYKFIRDSKYAQYQGINRCTGYLMMGYYANNMDLKSEGSKEPLEGTQYKFDETGVEVRIPYKEYTD
jgi:hypothetical protein